MALLTAPEYANVEIHTDSLAAIQILNKCDGHYSTKKWLKTSNTLWVLYIDTIKREKDLSVKLVKVQEHSGDTFNDLADEYTKKGGICDDILDIGFISSNSKVKFFPHFQKIPIVQKIRKFSISTLRLFTCAKWMQLYS